MALFTLSFNLSACILEPAYVLSLRLRLRLSLRRSQPPQSQIIHHILASLQIILERVESTAKLVITQVELRY